MNKIEAAFTTNTIEPYLNKNPMNAPWEVKHSRGAKFIPFSAVKDHQVTKLHNARCSFLNYKISDDSRGQKPFDGVSYFKSPEAYLIFVYPDMWCFIDILVFEQEERTSTRRSISQDRAREIATKVINTKICNPIANIVP
jgi:hypothetical protein